MIFDFLFNKKHISLLAAYTKSGRVIGAQGKIPWNLPSERTRFKQICKNKKIIMGRKSFEEIGHGLPYCTIIILSRTFKTAPEGCLTADTLEDAISLCKKNNLKNEILIAGGEQLYKQTIDMADTIYATEIEMDINGDTFFPQLDNGWKKVSVEPKEENGIKYQYVTYKRKL